MNPGNVGNVAVAFRLRNKGRTNVRDSNPLAFPFLIGTGGASHDKMPAIFSAAALFCCRRELCSRLSQGIAGWHLRQNPYAEPLAATFRWWTGD